MTQYTTQMDAARQGIITPQMEIVAEKEHFDVEELRELIAKGQVIIPCNKNHKSISPSGVGAKLTTKINVNLGVSRDWKDVDMEYEKVHSAVEMGAEAIMDLSSYGDTRSFRPQTYIRMSGNDRYCSDLRRSSILSQSTWQDYF